MCIATFSVYLHEWYHHHQNTKRKRMFQFTMCCQVNTEGDRELDSVEESSCEVTDQNSRDEADGNKVYTMRTTRSYDVLNSIPDAYTSDPEIPYADAGVDDDDLDSYESDFMEEMMAIHSQMVRRTQAKSGKRSSAVFSLSDDVAFGNCSRYNFTVDENASKVIKIALLVTFTRLLILKD